jgi:hypothetical protein
MKYVITLEDLLAATLHPDVVAKIGPRYPTFRRAKIDLNRVWESLQTVVRERRDEEPELVFNHLVALAGQALKTAADVAVANRTTPALAGVNVETALAVLGEIGED